MKETHKKALIIAGAIGATPVILIALAYTGLVLFVVSGAFAIFMPEPAEPLIKYGEFPFSITYEMNNEVITYEDVIICEYEGWEDHGTGGKVRKWSKRLKSGKEKIVIHESHTDGVPCEVSLRIPGTAKYYMGDFDLQSKEAYEHTTENTPFFVVEDGCNYSSLSKMEEAAWEKYGIRFISLEYSQPVENQFIEKD